MNDYIWTNYSFGVWGCQILHSIFVHLFDFYFPKNLSFFHFFGANFWLFSIISLLFFLFFSFFLSQQLLPFVFFSFSYHLNYHQYFCVGPKFAFLLFWIISFIFWWKKKLRFWYFWIIIRFFVYCAFLLWNFSSNFLLLAFRNFNQEYITKFF